MLPVPLLVVLALLFFLLAVIISVDPTAPENKMMNSWETREDMYPTGDGSLGMPGVSSGFPAEFEEGVGVSVAYPEIAPMPPIWDSGRPAPEGIERQIVSNAMLSLLVGRVEDAITSLKSIAVERNGRVENVDFQNTSFKGKKRATVVLRVPTTEFDATVEAVKAAAIKVEHENISATDVTDQMVDIDARVMNLEMEEDQYRDILEEAEKTEDILQVSQRLFQVREQIERLEAQKENLASLVGMSRITVLLASDPEVKPIPTGWNLWTSVEQAFQAVLLGLTALADFLIVLAVVLLPLVIVWGLVIIFLIWLIWKILLLVKRMIFGGHRSSPPPSPAPLQRSYAPSSLNPFIAQKFTSKSFPPSPSSPGSSKKNGAKNDGKNA